MLPGQTVQPLDRRVDELGVGREGDVLGLHGGVDGDARQIARAQRSAVVRHAQTLGQQQLEFVAQSLAPVAQPRTLVREGVLEELLAGKELEVRVLDPPLAHLLVRQRVDVLEQQQADHEARRHGRPALLAVQRRDLAVDPRPVDLGCQADQLVLGVDDLIEPGSEQIARSRRLTLLRPHRSPHPMRLKNHASPLEGIPFAESNRKVPSLPTPKPCNLKPALAPDTDSRSTD